MDASPAAPTNAPDPDETLLLSALRQREAKAYEQLMRRYNRLLFRAARGIVADDGEAQDVVQETYLRAFVGLEAFRGEASLGTWLTRIAINQALGQQRKLGRLVAWEDDPATQESEMSASDHPSNRADAMAPSPEQEAAQRQMRRRLEEAVDALTPIYRSVFLLRAVEGLSVEDTAQALQVSRDVVKTRFLRARAQLRERLRPEDESQAPTLHAFAGQRCDEVVARVLSRLRACGVIRDH